LNNISLNSRRFFWNQKRCQTAFGNQNFLFLNRWYISTYSRCWTGPEDVMLRLSVPVQDSGSFTDDSSHFHFGKILLCGQWFWYLTVISYYGNGFWFVAYDLRCGLQCGLSVQLLESYSKRSPREYDYGFNLRDQLHKLRKLSVGLKKN
jgi:hypothetical protein